MALTNIRLGGVPEHFNLPIHLAVEQGEFESRGVQLKWIEYAGGTGQMTKALAEDEVDMCVLLTEGITASIIKGNPSQIISEYVKTPLTWGVHTGFDNPLNNYQHIFDKQYAISRFGSGSHLMAIVDANSKKKQLDRKQFTVIKNLTAALESLKKGETDVFYWEKYTTKPYVDKGLVRRIGEYKTPWPCFVIAATNRILEQEPESVIRVLRTIHDSCDRFMMDDGYILEVSQRYGLTIEDAERWYHSTEWAIHGWISDKMLRSVIYYLDKADIISTPKPHLELIWERKNK